MTGTWTQPGTGTGVYDPDKWAVVFKYSSVNIPSGVTVWFKNHPSRAPVVWLVQGDVSIHGLLLSDGLGGSAGEFAEPGPGGFRGGLGPYLTSAGGCGPGPGGGCGYGSYADVGWGNTPDSVYGWSQILPLIGGSGAGRGSAGGGAILIACANTITVSGRMQATSEPIDDTNSTPRGSGGAVRLLAEEVGGSGAIDACGTGWWSVSGWRGGCSGRIRIEA